MANPNQGVFIALAAVIVGILLAVLITEQKKKSKPTSLKNLKSSSTGCSSCASRVNPRISEPCYNLEQICGQLVLLEDHLSSDDKKCKDCIAKHVIFLRALADEAANLDTKSQYTKDITQARNVLEKLSDKFTNGEDLANYRESIRKLRKYLLTRYYIPV